MDFESRCQKVIPTYLRIRMGRRSFTSRTWPSITDSSSLATKRNSKISMENSWKAHCPIDNRMISSVWSLKWHKSEHGMEQSTTLDHNRMDQSSDALTINHCHSNDSKMKHEIKKSTKTSHSIYLMKMIGGRKSQSHMKHKLSDLHRTHKRIQSTSKLQLHTPTYYVRIKNYKP